MVGRHGGLTPLMLTVLTRGEYDEWWNTVGEHWGAGRGGWSRGRSGTDVNADTERTFRARWGRSSTCRSRTRLGLWDDPGRSMRMKIRILGRP